MPFRFDSLDPRAPRSFVFRERRGEIVAWRTGEVIQALEAVEQAVATGLHAAGFVAYEAAPAFDPVLSVHEAIEGLPLLSFGLFAVREEVSPLAGIVPRGAGEVEQGGQWAGAAGYTLGALAPSIGQEEFTARISRIQELIAAGDSYQVNFTFRLTGDFHGDPAVLYADLCHAQQAAYCALLPAGRFRLVSASPELFFRWSDGVIETRPMKGTRPRGRWTTADDALAGALRESPKDRAENLMIVDLIRNDLGRVAEFGSVHVPSLFEVEQYPTVHQMTSTVRARTPEGTRLVDLFRALFPSGSVTGAPKIRTSEIIRELEDVPRGAYTGAIGFVSPGREATFSVAIRTVMIDTEESRAVIGVGSGITADSAAEDEYGECLEKGAFLRHREPEFELLESLRLEVPGGYPLLDLHLERLAGSARYFGFEYDELLVRDALGRVAMAGEAAKLVDVIEEAILGGEPEVGEDGWRAEIYKVRLRMDRSGGVRIDVDPIAARFPPARVAFSTVLVDPGDVFLYHKTTNRTVYDEALARRPDLDDVILVNRVGEVTEATRASLVIELDGDLVTPPLAAGLLPGVTRRQLIEGGQVIERTIRPDDLVRATRIWLVNAVRGWREAELEESAI